MQLRDRIRRARQSGATLLLVCLFGVALADAARATVPFPTHAPLSRSGSGAQNLGTGLGAGQQLNANQYLMSSNGQYELDMFGDGVGVLWNMPPGGLPCSMWIFPGLTTNVMSNYAWSLAKTPVAGSYLIMQGDGNFVQYPAPDQPALWASNTAGNPGATLTLQSDGNLVIYQGSSALWSTSTNSYRGPVLCEGNTLQSNQGLVQSKLMNSPFAVNDGDKEGGYHLLVNANGELEILGNHVPTKLSQGPAGSYLIMQDDGNLVYYAPDGSVNWATGTNGNGGAVAVMSNWGILYIMNPQTNVILWISGGPNEVGNVMGDVVKESMGGIE